MRIPLVIEERRVAPLLLCLFLNTLDRVHDRFCAGGQFLVELPADTGGAPDLLVICKFICIQLNICESTLVLSHRNRTPVSV
eukprot:SAG22_NODE_539_length_9317_cov_4.771209_3_plen_82_part_00